MQVIVRPRQGGKTTEMLRMAAENFSYIVCPTRKDVDRLWQLARTLDVDIPHPITWDEFVQGRYHLAGVGSFVIDDLDRCVQYMSHVEIKAISVTG